MVGQQGRHMQLICKAKKSILLEPDEEELLRKLVTRQDKNLVRCWFEENPSDEKDIKKSIVNGVIPKDKLLAITTKICCKIKLNISHRTVREVLMEV